MLEVRTRFGAGSPHFKLPAGFASRLCFYSSTFRWNGCRSHTAHASFACDPVIPSGRAAPGPGGPARREHPRLSSSRPLRPRPLTQPHNPKHCPLRLTRFSAGVESSPCVCRVRVVVPAPRLPDLSPARAKRGCRNARGCRGASATPAWWLPPPHIAQRPRDQTQDVPEQGRLTHGRDKGPGLPSPEEAAPGTDSVTPRLRAPRGGTGWIEKQTWGGGGCSRGFPASSGAKTVLRGAEAQAAGVKVLSQSHVGYSNAGSELLTPAEERSAPEPGAGQCLSKQTPEEVELETGRHRPHSALQASQDVLAGHGDMWRVGLPVSRSDLKGRQLPFWSEAPGSDLGPGRAGEQVIPSACPTPGSGPAAGHPLFLRETPAPAAWGALGKAWSHGSAGFAFRS